MRCVNQNGGYLCIPRALYSQPYRPDTSLAEPLYPDTSVGFSDTFVPGQRSVEPSYPRVRTTAQCVLGYTVAEDGTCNGEFLSVCLRGGGCTSYLIAAANRLLWLICCKVEQL